MAPMSLDPGLCRPSRCTNCDVTDEAGELHIAELQQIPWAYLTEAPSILYRGAPPEKSRSQLAQGLADGSSYASGGLDLVELPRKFVDGSYYAGQWLGDARHGQGRLERPRWGCYEGQFVNGKATGSGHFEKVTGDIYKGQWLNDRANGFGHYIHCDGSTYQGQWDSDLKSGKGQETWPDGSTYEGEFVLGRKHGHGTYHACDESSFEGQFRDDMMDGNGQYVFADGRVYSGQWERSRMMGDGCMQYPDGRKYVGQFKDDKKWGHGSFSWNDGRSYEGQWFRGKQHGKGVYTNKKGRRLDGQWSHGKTTLNFASPLASPLASPTTSRAASAEGLRAVPSGVASTSSSRAGGSSPSEGTLRPNSTDEDTDLMGKLEVYANLYMSERHASKPADVLPQVRAGDRPLSYTELRSTFGRSSHIKKIVDIDGRDISSLACQFDGGMAPTELSEDLLSHEAGV